VRYLLDTHALLWMITDDPRLGEAAREAITESQNRLFFSMSGYWEICIKISLNKLQLSETWPDIIDREMLRNGIEWLPIRQQHLLAVVDLPFHHRDPFDRLLISQAKTEELTLITRDPKMRPYGVDCVF
jgi:PIN domain nuclease of toxin-antitoxin system